MVIWTALWGQMNTDEQHTSSHCGSPLWPSRLWRDQLQQDQMSGQVLCGRVDSYRYYLDLQSIPSLLSCEAQKMVIFIPFLSAALYSCNFLSWSWFSPYLEACADTSHPPPLNSLLWAPSTLLEAPSTSPWLSNDTAGLVSSFSRPALPDHMSFGPGLPQAHVLVCLQPWVEVSSAQGWSWAGKMMKHNEAYPPGSHVQAWETQEDWKQPAQLYKLCLTSLIVFSKETDGSVGEGRTTGIFPWLGGQDTIRVFGLVSTQKTTWMANLKCFCSVLWSSSDIQFPQGSILRPASTFYHSPWWSGGWNGLHPEQDRQCGRNSQYSAK